MDERTKEMLNRLNQTEEQTQPQTNQTDTDARLTELENAVNILLTGVTE